jgi:hypothetical protein
MRKKRTSWSAGGSWSPRWMGGGRVGGWPVGSSCSQVASMDRKRTSTWPVVGESLGPRGGRGRTAGIQIELRRAAGGCRLCDSSISQSWSWSRGVSREIGLGDLVFFYKVGRFGERESKRSRRHGQGGENTWSG